MMTRILVVLGLLTHSSVSAKIIYHKGQDLRGTVKYAPAHATIICDRNERIRITKTVRIEKPLTIQGLNAGLVDGLGKTSILRVMSEGVSITDFELYGNTATVEQEVRAPLVTVEKGNFRVERGRFVNSSKDGVEINTVRDGGDIVGGIVRDVVGEGVVRDVVSISGSGRTDGLKVRNVLVENVRGIDSRLRGAVEVSDGAENITVRTVYAERCVYAVDVQDHNKSSQINRNILIEDVYAADSRYAIRTANRPFGHANLTIRDVVAERCERPLKVSNTTGVTIENVRISGHKGRRPAILISKCDEVVVRDVAIAGSGEVAGIVLENTSRVRVDGLRLDRDANSYTSGLIYRISDDLAYVDVTFRNVSVTGTQNAGILLENRGEGGSLVKYVIEGNASTVDDQIQGRGAKISGNAGQN
jgi:hypothetical protein